MNPVATFIRRPFKKGEDYFEYIALDGAVRVFDIDLAEPFWGRTDRTRFEAMFRTGQGRWVLMFLQAFVPVMLWGSIHIALRPGESEV